MVVKLTETAVREPRASGKAGGKPPCGVAARCFAAEWQ